jgi:hypothetical protein
MAGIIVDVDSLQVFLCHEIFFLIKIFEMIIGRTERYTTSISWMARTFIARRLLFLKQLNLMS